MAKESSAVTFVVSGQASSSGRTTGLRGGTSKASVRVGARRAGGETIRLTAQPGEDIVLLHLANGPTLYLHPEDARELLRAQQDLQSARGAADESADADVVVPAQLAWQGMDDAVAEPGTRGKVTDWIGNVVVDAIEVVGGLFKDKAADIAAAAVTRKVDGQVDPGVYELSAADLVPLKGVGNKLAKVPAAPSASDPMLVLMHGTFSNTAGTFGKLWSHHPGRVAELFKHYGNRVYGLEHETLGVSPFGNALMLVRALPKGARLHLLTHSRGGIVAEVLARMCGGQGMEDEDFALFADDEYQQHRADLKELAREIQQKKIVVERVVRVACPARGTLLASRRLDAYLSVLKWSMELAGLVVLPELVDFLAEVARRRTDPAELPGLEAMMPDRPMSKWLNAAGEPVAGQLRVVAGDIEGDSLLTWLKTLLSDAFYWTDNDLVVQTRSMYGGTPRADGAAKFVLDRGGKVTHFNYFSNERTAGLLTSGLLDDEPEHFLTIGPLSWAGEDASGTRAARAAKRSQAGNVAERPAVFVLPGILGSHLKVDGKRIWLSARFISNLDRLRWTADAPSRVAPDGPVGMSYDDLIDFLADSHEVIPFSFDWRRPIEDEAIRLAVEVDKALDVRQASQQAVRIVAHSMGGLVVRTMCLERPATWKRLLARPGARFLMLGTPNGGSFAPMQVLSGDDSFGNVFTTWGGLFDGADARQIVAGMPGLLQLQAGLTDSALGLGNSEKWKELQDIDLKRINRRLAQRALWHRDSTQLKALNWGIPTQAVLDRAVALRKRLDAQRDELGADASNMLLVVGKAKATPATVKQDGERVVYLDTAAGDGRVTLENAMLPGVKTWQVDVVHGELADVKKAFDGYLELLVDGDTTKLPKVTAGSLRGSSREARTETLVPSRPAHTMRAAAPPIDMREVFVKESERAASGAGASRLEVRVVNGNLKFVREPLLLGHYGSLKLTGTEAVIDDLLGNTMSESLRSGLYPRAVGSNQVFTNSQVNPQNPWALPRPQAAIVVGLGEEGSLRMSELVETIRQGTLAYAQRLVERQDLIPSSFDLAATLIGSGGAAISPGTAAQAVVLGVREANALLGRAQVQWPLVVKLQLIELYADRAAEALDALNVLSGTAAPDISVAPFIAAGPGALPRPASVGYRGSGDSDFISVHEQRTDAGSEFAFTLSTRRARDEVRGNKAQSKFLDELVRSGATDENEDPEIGRALFKLLVPLEIEPFLAGSTSLQLQLDPVTAAYPWEMLDLDRSDVERDRGAQPWGIQSRLLRKLRTAEFRADVRTADSAAGTLVIGEPQCRSDVYPPLPGAAAEAREVAAVFGVEPIINADASTIAKAVLNKVYAILHVAGHGDFVDGVGGIIMSNDAVFGPREVMAMRVVPQLAFINCCHLGSFNEPGKKTKSPQGGYPKFAANVAEQLIRIGVRCVIAAGWAVDDDAATLFARTFYRQLDQGRRFIDAVGYARTVTYERYRRSNTWAAYQCYGDPDWTFRPRSDGGTWRSSKPDVTSAAAVILHLQTLLSDHKFNGKSKQAIGEQLQALEGICKGQWDHLGAVAAAFGAAYGEIEDFPRAIDWYTRASSAADGGAGLKALEQLGNFRARHGADTGSREAVLEAIALLERVRSFGATVERDSLLGSAYKRLASVERSAAARRNALTKAKEFYRAAELLARKLGTDDLFYPAINRMSIELWLRSKRGPRGFDAADIAAIRQVLARKNDVDPEFWSVVAPIELTICEAIAGDGLALVLPGILQEIANVAKRSTSSLDWGSVTFQMRFTLDEYLKTPGLSAAERSAVKKLLQALPGVNE